MSNRNKWLDEEIEFLKLNYETKGVEFLVKNLTGHTKNSICKKAHLIGLSVDKTIYSYNKEEVRIAVKSSFNYKEVLRFLNKVSSGTAYKYLIKFIKKNNIDTSHFDSWKNNRVLNSKRNYCFEDIFTYNSLYKGGTKVIKDKLYKNGLKKRECELCGQGEEWNGKKMSLILDHINGINNDNRIENLRIVCPNCNATLETHCLGYKGLKKEKTIPKHFSENNHCECGTLISNKSKKCKKCDEINQRKIERPEYSILMKEVEEMGYLAIGRKYGVSDNSIRKWIKTYEKINIKN